MKKIILLAILGLPAILAAQSEVLWIEGESADKSTARKHGWYDSVKKDQLSGGDWLSNFSNAGPAEGTWNFEVSEAGGYEFWVRANPVGARLSWRLNGGGDWSPVDFSDALDQTNIAGDGGIDIRFVAWAKIGKVKLATGKNAIEFRMDSKNQNHGGLDCFAFSRTPFTQKGKMKPGEKLGLADEGSWAFEPGADPLSPEARLDLSSLNEDTAGMHGYVGHDAIGDFIDGRGQPLRFWAANTGLSR